MRAGGSVLMLLAAGQAPTDVTAWLIGTPVTVLAFLVVAFIRGWIVPGVVHQRRLAELAEQTAEIRRLHVTFEEKVIPALTRSTDLLADAAQRERTR